MIRTGDTVKILIGKDRAKTGKVLSIDRQGGRATVEGLNMVVRHERPKKAGQKGQKVHVPMPVRTSNLMLICPNCKKPARAGHETDEKGTKYRVCKKCKRRI